MRLVLRTISVKEYEHNREKPDWWAAISKQ